MNSFPGDATGVTAQAAEMAAAAAAKVGPVDGAAGASAPITEQAEVIYSAALQVFAAFRVLCWEAGIKLVTWVYDHPMILNLAVGGPVLYFLIFAVRRYLNLRWERELKDTQTPRRIKNKSPVNLDGMFADDPAAESEDDSLSHYRGRTRTAAASGQLSPTVADRLRCHRVGSPSLITATSRQLQGPEGLTLPESRPDPLDFLANLRVFADFNKECLAFLQSQHKVISVEAGETIFQRGDSRDGFLVVLTGKAIVGARRANASDQQHGDEYTLEAGDVIVGCLFVLASVPAEDDVSSPGPPDVCTIHSSSAVAGEFGAEVLSIPTSAFSAAFDQFPEAMLDFVRRMVARSSMVVLETLSTHFGLRGEILVPCTYTAMSVEDVDLSKMPAPDIFARFLGKSFENLKDSKKKAVQDVLDCSEIVEFQDGDFALPSRQRATHILILLEGEIHMDMEVVDRQPSCFDSISDDIGLSTRKWGRRSSRGGPYQVNIGEAIGEMSIMVDRPSPIIYRCASQCRVAALPRESAQKLFDLCPRVWTLKLLHQLAARTASWIHRIDAALDWWPVEGGQCLYRKGDPAVGFFVVLSGRLIAMEEKMLDGRSISTAGTDSRLHWQVSDVIQRGRLCGEIDCLRGTPYSQTVRASRDSEVCRVSPTILHLLAMDFPKAILYFSALMGPRSQDSMKDLARHRATIAVIPAADDVDMQAVCTSLTAALNKLGKAMHISPSSMMTGLQGNKAGSLSGLDGARLGRHFAQFEERCRWVVYEAEPARRNKVTDWTRRCVRQADYILVVVKFDGSSRGDVPESANELYINDSGLLHVDRDLLIVHESSTGFLQESLPQTKDDWFASTARAADTLRPGLQGFVAHHTQLFLGHRKGNALRSTRHYLNTRPWARQWHHVRHHEPSDWARCTRLLAGCGIGLCLGGGGARGNCHFGVVQALQELGIPIDVISGTSFGALAGGIVSMTAPEPKSLWKVVTRVMGHKFKTRGLLMDLNFPRTSYFTGWYLNNVLKDTFARRRCEDLLVPFACPSTDIVEFQEKMHCEGPLWRTIRGSMSLVGFVPPFPFRERKPEDGTITNSLLVDGGYVNQYPIEVLKNHGAGAVICVVACPDYDPIFTDFGDYVCGGLDTFRSWFGCCRRRPIQYPPTQAEIQERLMFLVESMKESFTSRSDLTIYPEIHQYGLLDFAKFNEISAVGYKAALPALTEWLSKESPVCQQVRDIIAYSKELEGAKPSVNQTEYGGRRRYAQWRAARRKASAILRAGGEVLRQKRGMRREMHGDNSDSGGDEGEGQGLRHRLRRSMMSKIRASSVETYSRIARFRASSTDSIDSTG